MMRWFVRSIFFGVFYLSFSVQPLEGVGAEGSLLTRWKRLHLSEQAECGTSLAKAMVDSLRSSQQQNALRPIFFWIITLADDSLAFYNSWFKRGDQEFYTPCWLLRDLFWAVKELLDEPSGDDLDLLDTDDIVNDGDEASVGIGRFLPYLSSLCNAGLSAYGVLSNQPEDHKKRVVTQGIKSLIRCGRWYGASAGLEKKSAETRLSFGMLGLNILSLAKSCMSAYPAHTTNDASAS